jgi:predicted Zn-dependent protease
MGTPTKAQATSILDKVLQLARAPGTDCFASLSANRHGNTRFAVNEISSSSDVEKQTLSVTIQIGKRQASATTNQLDERSLVDVVERAKRMAKLAPENPEALPPLGRQTYKAVPGASDPATANLTPAARAKAVGAALALSKEAVIAGYFEHTARMHALASSQGLRANHEWTACDFRVTARTADATGSGWGGGTGHRFADLDAGALAKIAVDKAKTSAKPTKLAPGRYTVVLEPAAVSDLFGWLTGAFGARRADEGRSFFSKPGGGTRLGEKLFPEWVTVKSNPLDPALTARPFDGEGFPLAPTTWIDKGVVKALAYTRYWAQKQGKPATGNPSGWTLEGGKATREELIKGVKRGVLITRLWYLRSLDPQTILVTGLTRDGVYLIENGAVTRPVTNFRFNDSPVTMLAKCDAMTPATISQWVRVPALRTHEFNLASVSEAV